LKVVHVVKQKTLQAWASEKRFETARKELEIWFFVADHARWLKLLDVQADFTGAEAVHIRKETYTVFNICRNAFRLIVHIDYRNGRIFVKDFLAHKEYDRDGWKKKLIQEQIRQEDLRAKRKLR
jgi:mRNA interferase HigB